MTDSPCYRLSCPLLAACVCLVQADVVLSRLVSSCRQQDPGLLDELRGELLYMARVLEQPVRELEWEAG